ncbi:hypothetical protein ACQPZP_22610 [Spirillospora sp. CA-142024]|uniref:hypothetical protein n=1 Tax=Spirillospora sp. CA-142024 TaxID=3240036 RepID=UPI003D8EEAA0
MMDTPSVPGNGSDPVSKNATRTSKATGNAVAEAAGRAGGTAKGTVMGAKDAAQTTARGAAKGAARVGGRISALPRRAAGLARLLTLGRFLRAVPIAAAAVAGVVVGRITARRR